MNGTTTLSPPTDSKYIHIIIPAVLAPLVFFLLLFMFCLWAQKRTRPVNQRRKPSTYEDFSRVDNTDMLRMSIDVVLDDKEDIEMSSKKIENANRTLSETNDEDPNNSTKISRTSGHRVSFAD